MSVLFEGDDTKSSGGSRPTPEVGPFSCLYGWPFHQRWHVLYGFLISFSFAFLFMIAPELGIIQCTGSMHYTDYPN